MPSSDHILARIGISVIGPGHVKFAVIVTNGNLLPDLRSLYPLHTVSKIYTRRVGLVLSPRQDRGWYFTLWWHEDVHLVGLSLHREEEISRFPWTERVRCEYCYLFSIILSWWANTIRVEGHTREIPGVLQKMRGDAPHSQ